MTVDQLIGQAIFELTSADVPEPRVSVNVLLLHATGWTREQLLMARQDEISQTHIKKFQSLLKQRRNRTPVAYITGQKEFYGRTFLVQEDVLIPRPETELLVDWVIEKYKSQRDIQICDVGTGSGVLAITLTKELPHATMVGADVCEKALIIARKNALQMQADVQWVTSDLLTGVTGIFDLIVANLPYVDANDMNILAPEVLKEPHRALFAADQGFDLLNKLVVQADKKMKPSGWLVLEHGQGQQKKMMEFLRETGWIHIKGYNDLAGIDRMVVAQKKSSI